MPLTRKHRGVRKSLVVTVAVATAAASIVAMGSAAPAQVGTDEVAGAACPAPYTEPMACATWWGLPVLPDAPLPVARSQAARLLAAAVVRSGVGLHAPAQNVFADDDGHPEELVLAELAALGVVRGTSQTTSAPDAPASRGQLTALVVRTAAHLLGSEPEAVPTPFTDIGSSTHREAIEQAYALGLVRGVDDDHFRPDATASYGQLAAIVTRLLGVLVAEGTVDPPLSGGSFSVAVVPDQVERTIPGQRLVLLVTVVDAGGTGPVSLEASAPGADVSTSATLVQAGTVAEVTVVPQPGGGQADSPEAWLPVTFTGTRDGARHRVVVPVRVMPGEDTLRPDASEILATWTTWLAKARPELGIGPSTTWTPTITKPSILVVSHYLFFSQEWELGLTWHIMIPPYDWTEIYLRPRGELAPVHAFRLDSRSDPAAVPHPVAPPPVVDR